MVLLENLTIYMWLTWCFCCMVLLTMRIPKSVNKRIPHSRGALIKVKDSGWYSNMVPFWVLWSVDIGLTWGCDPQYTVRGDSNPRGQKWKWQYLGLRLTVGDRWTGRVAITMCGQSVGKWVSVPRMEWCGRLGSCDFRGESLCSTSPRPTFHTWIMMGMMWTC